MLTIPVLLHRERVATRTEGDSLFMNEQVTTNNTATGSPVPGFDPTNVDLVVDRSTKEYLAGSDEGRTGQWGMPFHVIPTASTTPTCLCTARAASRNLPR